MISQRVVSFHADHLNVFKLKDQQFGLFVDAKGSLQYIADPFDTKSCQFWGLKSKALEIPKDNVEVVKFKEIRCKTHKNTHGAVCSLIVNHWSVVTLELDLAFDTPSNTNDPTMVITRATSHYLPSETFALSAQIVDTFLLVDSMVLGKGKRC